MSQRGHGFVVREREAGVVREEERGPTLEELLSGSGGQPKGRILVSVTER